MIARRHRVFLWGGLLAALGWLTIALLDPEAADVEALSLGYFFGSLFGHTTLAAAWAALGPGRLIWRLPLSLVWVLLLAVGIALNVGIHNGPGDAAIIVGICLLGQWLLLQFPLWSIVLGFGIQLRHTDEEGTGLNQVRFGIRQLMIVTAIVGVVFGIGRVVLGKMSNWEDEFGIFAFLAVAAIVLTLPLLLAALMRRLAILGIPLALLFIGVATAWELPLFDEVVSQGGPNTDDFVSINVVSAAWTLAYATVVRLNGYSLGARDTPTQQNTGR